MKLKYQLRGLGIGMIVTAILMGVATGHAIPLTDAEIKARALELGMVEGGSLKLTDLEGMSPSGPQADGESDDSGQESGNPEENPDSGAVSDLNGAQGSSGMDGSFAESAQPDPKEEGDDPENPETGSSGSGTSGESGIEESGESEESGMEGAGESGEADIEGSASHVIRNGEAVSIVIEPGSDSYAISKTLAEAGLVEDAGEFDRFLCNNLYSRKIVDGTYDIPAGASEEEIAKIITRDR